MPSVPKNCRAMLVLMLREIAHVALDVAMQSVG
jgi:hypothetical protein